MTEIWKAVPGYEGYYAVSNMGNVKAMQRKIVYVTGQFSTFKERVLRPDNMEGGYKRVTLSKNNTTKRFFVHRLVALVFIPNPMSKPHINHIDNNPENNSSDNLEWVTPQENANHCVAQNRQSGLGERNYFCRNTVETILKVRLEQGLLSASVAANKYGMSKTNVLDIWNRKVWKHI